MSQKIALLFTLVALQAMLKPELQGVYKSVYPEDDLDDSVTKAELLDKILAVAEPAPPAPPAPRKKQLAEGEFEVDGVTYKAIVHAVNIPGIGVRSALEIAADEEAQAYLIKEGCVGSVIEVVE